MAPSARGRSLLSFPVYVWESPSSDGFLSQDPDGPLLAAEPEDHTTEQTLAQRAPRGAAIFKVYAGATGAEEARIIQRTHEIAGGFRAFLDLNAAIEGVSGELQRQAIAALGDFALKAGPKDETPSDRLRRELQERSAHAELLQAWMREHAALNFNAYLTMVDLAARHAFAARLEVLTVEAPAAYRPIAELTFADPTRWDALRDAHEQALRSYREEKARPSAG